MNLTEANEIAVGEKLSKIITALYKANSNVERATDTAIGLDNKAQNLKIIHDLIIDIGKNYKAYVTPINNALAYHMSSK